MKCQVIVGAEERLESDRFLIDFLRARLADTATTSGLERRTLVGLRRPLEEFAEPVPNH